MAMQLALQLHASPGRIAERSAAGSGWQSPAEQAPSREGCNAAVGDSTMQRRHLCRVLAPLPFLAAVCLW
jgi:hypothetical protein